MSASPARLPVRSKLALAVEILRAYVVARRMLHRRGLPGTLVALRAPRRDGASPSTADGRRLARAVVRTLTPLPADSRCLMRSLVLTRLMASRGIDTQLVIAVSPGEKFAAHSWIERDGEPLLPPSGPDFGRLVTL
jgi:hypothetical protein